METRLAEDEEACRGRRKTLLPWVWAVRACIALLL